MHAWPPRMEAYSVNKGGNPCPCLPCEFGEQVLVMRTQAGFQFASPAPGLQVLWHFDAIWATRGIASQTLGQTAGQIASARTSPYCSNCRDVPVSSPHIAMRADWSGHTLQSPSSKSLHRLYSCPLHPHAILHIIQKENKHLVGEGENSSVIFLPGS